MANSFENDSIEEKSNIFKKIASFKNISLIFLIFIFINLLILDILIFKGVNIKTISIPSSQNTQNDLSCSSACITKINEAVQTFNKPSVLPTDTPIPTKTPAQSGSFTSNVKEYYVPFGSGSGSSLDWQDISGLQASVDNTSYPNIKSIVFEVSLHIPTGNEIASVRLYNATDGRVVANSQLDFNGNTTSQLLISQPVNLDYGNKLYKVQMKTQLQFNAILDQSRLHITTK